MNPQSASPEVGRAAWRIAGGRCRCIRPMCHTGFGRCSARLGSCQGRVALVDPRGPREVWNCILPCTACLETVRRVPRPTERPRRA